MDELENMSREDLLRGIAFLRSEVALREESRQALFAERASLRDRVAVLESALKEIADRYCDHDAAEVANIAIAGGSALDRRDAAEEEARFKRMMAEPSGFYSTDGELTFTPLAAVLKGEP